MMDIEKGIASDLENIQKKDSKKIFEQLIQKSEYVGELSAGSQSVPLRGT